MVANLERECAQRIVDSLVHFAQFQRRNLTSAEWALIEAYLVQYELTPYVLPSEVVPDATVDFTVEP